MEVFRAAPSSRDSAVFTLGAVPASFTLLEISNVTFQYGTTLRTESNLARNSNS